MRLRLPIQFHEKLLDLAAELSERVAGRGDVDIVGAGSERGNILAELGELAPASC